jgi:hypothetical protein
MNNEVKDHQTRKGEAMLAVYPHPTPEEIEAKRDQLPRGVACMFVKLNEQWGLKVYRDSDTRDSCYRDQKRMATYGFGPQVGPSFKVGYFYVYVTQVAMPLMDAADGNMDRDDFWREFDELNQNHILRRMIRELQGKMKAKGWELDDAHVNNIGVIDGLLVCIDFGNE